MGMMEDRIALVTRVSTRAGTTIAAELARHGAAVAVHGHEEAVISDLVAGIRASGGRSIPVSGEITHYSQAEAVRRQVEEGLGKVDILVADAGESPGAIVPLEEISENSWRAILDANLLGTFLILKSFLPAMKERRRGVIITIAPTAGGRPDDRTPLPYGAAAAAIARLTQDVAIQAGQYGIRANCIAPKAMDPEPEVEAIKGAPQAARPVPHSYMPDGTPADVARAAIFLASDAASLVTGQVLDITTALRLV